MNNITFIKEGNIFDSKCHTLVCPVNCVGVMGKGLALEFKKRFPVYKTYKYLCDNENIKIGIVYYFYITVKGKSKGIVLFPTKNHWRNKSQIKDIEIGLKRLLYVSGALDIKSLAVPALGCGLGGLEWEEVKPLMIEYLSNFNIPVEIYEPKEVKQNE